MSIEAMDRRERWGWWLVMGITTGLVVAPTLTPFVSPDVRTLIMHGFSTVCHQFANRSPHIDGVQLAVCHRCYGIYMGLPAAAVLYLGLRRIDGFLGPAGRWILPLSLVPLSIDWSLDVFGLWTNTPTSRLITGGLFGLAAGYYFTRAVIDIFASPTRKQQSLSSQPAG